MNDATPATCFLRSRGRVLVRRHESGEHADRWDAVTVDAPADDADAVRKAVADATGLSPTDLSLVRVGRALDADGRRRRPVLLDWEAREAAPPDGHEWLHPTELRHRETTPGLVRAYERVGPTVNAVVADGEHGAAYLSLRALEVLRDRAGLLASEDADPAEAWDELTDLARRLRAARPSMAPIANRVDRAMHEAAADRTAKATESAAADGIDRAVAADRDAAENAADLVDGRTAFTLSRSGTVLDALREGAPRAVVVAESRPDREGVATAEALAGDLPVTLTTDAAAGYVLAERTVDLVLVGADAVLPDGSVVNKTGTRTVALVAAHEDVPVYAVAATDKVATGGVSLEEGDRSAVYDGDADLDVLNPTFDVTPASHVDGVVTERGTLDAADVEAVADELREAADWE